MKEYARLRTHTIKRLKNSYQLFEDIKAKRTMLCAKEYPQKMELVCDLVLIHIEETLRLMGVDDVKRTLR